MESLGDLRYDLLPGEGQGENEQSVLLTAEVIRSALRAVRVYVFLHRRAAPHVEHA